MQQIYRQVEKNIFSYEKAFKMYEPQPVFKCFIWPKEEAIDYLSHQPDWEIHKPIEKEYSDLIVPKLNIKAVKEYDPFEVKNLYLAFLDLDYSNESILDFVNTYGYLEQTLPEEMLLNKKNLISSIVRNYETFSIREIKAEIEKLQSLKKLYEAIEKDNLDFLKSYREEVLNERELIIDNLNEEGNLEKRLLKEANRENYKAPIKQWARETLAERFNFYGRIHDNYTSLISTNNGYVTRYLCRNLLAAIYLQFAWHISEEKEFRRCKNDKCNILFDVPASSRQVFHSKSCKNTYNSRKSQGYI